MLVLIPGSCSEINNIICILFMPTELLLMTWIAEWFLSWIFPPENLRFTFHSRPIYCDFLLKMHTGKFSKLTVCVSSMPEIKESSYFCCLLYFLKQNQGDVFELCYLIAKLGAFIFIFKRALFSFWTELK